MDGSICRFAHDVKPLLAELMAFRFCKYWLWSVSDLVVLLKCVQHRVLVGKADRNAQVIVH